MKTKVFLICLAIMALQSCKNEQKETQPEEETTVEETLSENIMDRVKIHPISHATMVLEWDKTIIYVDPVGGAEAFRGMKKPDIILITDIHGDHLHPETVAAILTENTKIIAPQAVIKMLPKTMEKNMQLLKNDESKNFENITFTGVPMYNLREEALQYHEKGRGNGYLMEKDGHRIYISGDTEDIIEMRNLKNIDIAFVCMNLPYTMTVASAADAVGQFQPKVVVPYHYRGVDGLSDIAAFKEEVANNAPEVEVLELDWYPSNQ